MGAAEQVIKMCRGVGVVPYMSLTCHLAYLTYPNIYRLPGRNGLDKFMSDEMMQCCGKGRQKQSSMNHPVFKNGGGPVPVRLGRNGAQVLADL
jgi:hypothetical protein